jgi:glycosyltransferase involved in cell wall biosynthesis
LPSKIFEYLGMERPILLSVGGDARNLVEEAAAGEYVPPGDAPAMAAAIMRLAADPATRLEMGQSGREYVLRHFDRRALAMSYLDILRTVVNRGSVKAVATGFGISNVTSGLRIGIGSPAK